jgi:hypothetical protein
MDTRMRDLIRKAQLQAYRYGEEQLELPLPLPPRPKLKAKGDDNAPRQLAKRKD